MFFTENTLIQSFNTYTGTSISGLFWTLSRMEILHNVNDSEQMGNLGIMQPTVSVWLMSDLPAKEVPGRYGFSVPQKVEFPRSYKNLISAIFIIGVAQLYSKSLPFL
jgi:hypothetical protein